MNSLEPIIVIHYDYFRDIILTETFIKQCILSATAVTGRIEMFRITLLKQSYKDQMS